DPRVQRHLAQLHLRPRPGSGARLLRREARLRGQRRRRHGQHALVDRQRARRRRPPHPAREAGSPRDGRRRGRAGARPTHQGSDGPRVRIAYRRLPQDLRGARGQGRRVHLGARRAVLRRRLRAPRPVREPHPDRPASARARPV
ncbi:MAG: hypothetical protein AVDCRST_MAG17-556, partial [uncultured Solirubrobacterales bacterium]